MSAPDANTTIRETSLLVQSLYERAVEFKGSEILLPPAEGDASAIEQAQIIMASCVGTIANQVCADVGAVWAVLDDPRRGMVSVDEFNRRGTITLISGALMIADLLMEAARERVSAELALLPILDPEQVADVVCSRALAQLEDVYSLNNSDCDDFEARYLETEAAFSTGFYALVSGVDASDVGILAAGARSMATVAASLLAMGAHLVDRARRADLAAA